MQNQLRSLLAILNKRFHLVLLLNLHEIKYLPVFNHNLSCCSTAMKQIFSGDYCWGSWAVKIHICFLSTWLCWSAYGNIGPKKASVKKSTPRFLPPEPTLKTQQPQKHCKIFPVSFLFLWINYLRPLSYFLEFAKLMNSKKWRKCTLACLSTLEVCWYCSMTPILGIIRRCLLCAFGKWSRSPPPLAGRVLMYTRIPQLSQVPLNSRGKKLMIPAKHADF